MLLKTVDAVNGSLGAIDLNLAQGMIIFTKNLRFFVIDNSLVFRLVN